MEITGCWKNCAISFWENDAEIGAVFEIVSSLQHWAIMAGPHTENGANHLGLPSDCANGPNNLGPKDSHWRHSLGLTGGWAHGPDKIRPERRLLEAPMDRMRSYPLLLNSNSKACF